MSDEPTTATTDDAPQKQYGIAWGDEIDETRKQELWKELRAFLGRPIYGDESWGPFTSYWGLSGADLFWLAVYVQANSIANGTPSDLRAAKEELLALRDGFDNVDTEVDLTLLHLEGIHLKEPLLERCYLRKSWLQGAIFSSARMREADFSEADLRNADFTAADLQRANLSAAHLQGANFLNADLNAADLGEARLQGASLIDADLQKANLCKAQLQGATLERTDVRHADLRGAILSGETVLRDTQLAGPLTLSKRLLRKLWPHWIPDAPALGDIHWAGVGSVDLTQVADWHIIERIGDERYVTWRDGAEAHQNVVRAYRQVATQVRAQGMTEVADRLSHRALSYERRVFLRRGNIPRYLGSWLLAMIAGYGYRPLYTIFWYLVVVLGFAFAYWHFGPGEGVPFSPLGALVLSVTSFHGRGFFPGGSPGHSLTLDDPVTVLAALEAVFGLLIEISFIATFTQRFFGAK